MNYDELVNQVFNLKDMVDYLDRLEILFWVVLLIEAIAIIVFFIQCSNIAKIRRSVHEKGEFEAIFNFYYSIGDFCKAKECLYRQIINDDYLNGVFNSTAKECKDTRPFFISKY